MSCAHALLHALFCSWLPLLVIEHLERSCKCTSLSVSCRQIGLRNSSNADHELISSLTMQSCIENRVRQA